MAKKQKETVEAVEETTPTSSYDHITGPSKEYIIRILRRVEKAPRIKTSFEKIIDAVKKKQSEEGENADENLEKLIEQLDSFVNPKDARQATAFNDYSYKFTFVP